MKFEEIKEAVFIISSKVFKKDISELSEDTDYKTDLGATSIQFYQLIALLEEQFEIDIIYRSFWINCNTIGDTIKYINDLCEVDT